MKCWSLKTQALQEQSARMKLTIMPYKYLQLKNLTEAL